MSNQVAYERPLGLMRLTVTDKPADQAGVERLVRALVHGKRTTGSRCDQRIVLILVEKKIRTLEFYLKIISDHSMIIAKF